MRNFRQSKPFGKFDLHAAAMKFAVTNGDGAIQNGSLEHAIEIASEAMQDHVGSVWLSAHGFRKAMSAK